MSKKHFIALADAIKEHNAYAHARMPFTNSHISSLAKFCKSQNHQFNESRWLDYIARKCGPNGGRIREQVA